MAPWAWRSYAVASNSTDEPTFDRVGVAVSVIVRPPKRLMAVAEANSFPAPSDVGARPAWAVLPEAPNQPSGHRERGPPAQATAANVCPHRLPRQAPFDAEHARERRGW